MRWNSARHDMRVILFRWQVRLHKGVCLPNSIFYHLNVFIFSVIVQRTDDENWQQHRQKKIKKTKTFFFLRLCIIVSWVNGSARFLSFFLTRHRTPPSAHFLSRQTPPIFLFVDNYLWEMVVQFHYSTKSKL